MIKKGFIVSLLIFGIAVITITSVFSEIHNKKKNAQAISDIDIHTLANTDEQMVDIVGQVTIRAVDSDEDNLKLNDSVIEIVSKSTGEKITVIVKNGLFVHELLMGSYIVRQVQAQEGYAVDSNSYEFTLEIPPELDRTKIKAVNADVTFRNQKVSSGNIEMQSTTASDPIGFDDGIGILIMIAVALLATMISLIVVVMNLQQKIKRIS